MWTHQNSLVLLLVTQLSQPVQADKSTRSSKVTHQTKNFRFGESDTYQYVVNKRPGTERLLRFHNSHTWPFY